MAHFCRASIRIDDMDALDKTIDLTQDDGLTYPTCLIDRQLSPIL